MQQQVTATKQKRATSLRAELGVTPSSTLHPENGRLATLKAAAAISDFGYGEWAYEEWQRHNRDYFAGALKVGGIFWGLTRHGKSLGFYEPWRNGITLHTSLVKPSGNAWGIVRLLGKRFASDVLLHEMIHQAIHQFIGSDGETKASETIHNNPAWVAEVNRLSALLGLSCKAEVIRQRRVKGKVCWFVPDGCLTQRQLASWPYSVRPKGYYEPETAELLKKAIEAE